MSTILKVDDINVYYGSIHAIKGISFEVNEGEIVTLIGANGAGKSTTLNTISGLLHSQDRLYRASWARPVGMSQPTRSSPRDWRWSPRDGGSSSRCPCRKIWTWVLSPAGAATSTPIWSESMNSSPA
ncbi:MAG: ATP-binding cassette domain-containing protein [Dysosmobacter sp.]